MAVGSAADAVYVNIYVYIYKVYMLCECVCVFVSVLPSCMLLLETAAGKNSDCFLPKHPLETCN